MDSLSLPTLRYSKTAEIPAALAALSEEELTAVIEARLRGQNAGLPQTFRDEDPGDILLYAFEQGGEAFQQMFSRALSKVLDRTLRATLMAGALPLNGNRRLLEGAFFLVGQTGARTALDIAQKFLPVIDGQDTALVQRLAGCIAALAGPEDDRLVPWLLQKAQSPELCRIAFEALFRIHRPSAAAALPTVVSALLASGEDNEASLALARTLAFTLGGLSEQDQAEFFKQVGRALCSPESAPVRARLISVLGEVPGIGAAAAREISTWALPGSRRRLPAWAEPRHSVREDWEAAAEPPTARGRSRKTADGSKDDALAHVDRVKAPLDAYGKAGRLENVEQVFAEAKDAGLANEVTYNLYKDTKMVIGTRLRQLREGKDFSQGDIEKRTGLLRCYISRVENGHTVPSLETLERLASALEIPLYQMFYEGEEPPPLPNLSKRRSTEELLEGADEKEVRFFEKVRKLVSKIDDKGRQLLLFMAQKLASRSGSSGVLQRTSVGALRSLASERGRGAEAPEDLR